MSLAELKRAVDDLPAEERLDLAAHIHHSLRVDDPSWQAEVGRRLNACLKGEGHGEEELLALHNRPSAGEP